MLFVRLASEESETSERLTSLSRWGQWCSVLTVPDGESGQFLDHLAITCRIIQFYNHQNMKVSIFNVEKVSDSSQRELRREKSRRG
jgi:hypothetical protein